MATTRDRFAFNLRRIRLAADVSQEALAAEIGYERAMISVWERAVKGANFSTVDALAKALKVDVSEFFIAPPLSPPRDLSPPKRAKAR